MPASNYKHDVDMVVRVTEGKQGHPVVRGVGDIVTNDECYRGMWHAPGYPGARWKHRTS